MKAVATLIDMLAHRAQASPEVEAVAFGPDYLDFKTLYRQTRCFASHLLELGVKPGDRVVVALPNGLDFFPVFYGIQMAGGIAVPLYANSGPERITRVAGFCGALLAVLQSHHCDLPTLQVTTPELGLDHADDGEFPLPKAHDLAFLQYTSGSTGDPKGVGLSHHNLLTNMNQMIVGMAITPEDVFVSWLPVCHDMGLILMTMVPFYLAARLILLPANLTAVRPWLAAIEKARGSFTAAPDFAYRMCLRYIKDPAQYNLGSLRVALNAAEPVRAATVRDFEAAFGLNHVMSPAYGLAEATVGVSMWPPNQPVLVDDRGLVSVGKPFAQITVSIRDGETPLPPGQPGDITLASPATTRGYFHNPKATEALFQKDGYLNTGDSGYLDQQGNLFIAGRSKNIIISGGRNISPGEVEEVVDRHESVRFSAAVGIDKGRIEGEQVFVFAEIRRGASLTQEQRYDLALDLVAAFHQELGYRPARLYLVKTGTIPRTLNGKIRHPELKRRYVTGELGAEGLILYPDH